MTRLAFHLAFAAVYMLTPAGVMAQRGAAFADPPMLGWFSFDSTAITAAPSLVASADWPDEFWVEALAEVRACSRVKGDLQGYHLYTVTTGFDGFRVKWLDTATRKWREAVFAGWTFPDRKEIYVVQRGLHNKQLLKHEMLHAVLASRGLEYWHGSGLADGMFARCFPK